MINLNMIYDFCSGDVTEIENFMEALKDREQTWDCHHRMETHRRNGKERVTRLTSTDLVEWGIYYNRPASELIMLPHSEHTRLHQKGKKVSEETRRKLSEASKGNTKRLGKYHTDESKEKNRQSHLGKPSYDRTPELNARMSEIKKAYWARKKASFN